MAAAFRALLPFAFAALVAACSNGGESDTPPALLSLAPPSDAAASGLCGSSPLPLCPLQSWMRTNAAPAMKDRRADRLEGVFRQMAAFAPPGYAEWQSLAETGAKAASAGDITAAQRACADCHRAYRSRYQTELRSRAIFASPHG
jgi:hypothetical protein